MYIQVAKYAGTFVAGGVVTYGTPKLFRLIFGSEETASTGVVSREGHNVLVKEINDQRKILKGIQKSLASLTGEVVAS